MAFDFFFRIVWKKKSAELYGRAHLRATKVLSLLMVIGLRTSPKSVRKQEHPQKHECQKRAAGKKMDGSNQSVGFIFLFLSKDVSPCCLYYIRDGRHHKNGSRTRGRTRNLSIFIRLYKRGKKRSVQLTVKFGE